MWSVMCDVECGIQECGIQECGMEWSGVICYFDCK
jgi:hypothetical protein